MSEITVTTDLTEARARAERAADLLRALRARHDLSRYEFTRTDAPYDATAVRFEIPGRGTFGVIANETEPFCSSCTRLRLSSNGFLYGCLSNAANHDMRPVLQEPHHQAMARLQSLLVRALGDKQDLSFTGEVTVMKFIGG